jgi:hypothetical protein
VSSKTLLLKEKIYKFKVPIILNANCGQVIHYTFQHPKEYTKRIKGSVRGDLDAGYHC